jgi:hypothetical protein
MVLLTLEIHQQYVLNSISEIVNIISHNFWCFPKSDLRLLLSDIGKRNSNFRKLPEATSDHLRTKEV